MSNWIRGTVVGHKAFSDALVAAATGSSISAPVINAAGTGYVVGDILTVVGGTFTIAAQVEVVTVGGSGEVLTMRMYNAGVYTSTPSVTANAVTGGTGSAATVDLTYAANGWAVHRDEGRGVSAVDSVVAGGTGYSEDDIITLAGGTFTEAATLRVTGETAGVIDTVSVETAGDYEVIPADPVAQDSVAPSGGTGATFNLTFRAGELEVILEGEGGGSDEIFIGWRTISNVGGDYYNLELHGLTGFSAALPMDEQPGVSPGFWDAGLSADRFGSYLLTTSVSFNYFLNISAFRIIMTAKIGSNYFHSYLGWGNRFATASEYPYPMICAGAHTVHSDNGTFGTSISTLTDPWSTSSSSRMMQVRGTDGTWYVVMHRYGSTNIDDRVVVPCGEPQGTDASPSLPQDRFMDDEMEFNLLIPLGGGVQPSNLVPSGDASCRVLLPSIVVFSLPSPQILMEIDEVYWVSTFGGVVSEDRFIDSDGIVYRLFKNGNRSEAYAFLAIKESD